MLDQKTIDEALGMIELLIANNALTVVLEKNDPKPVHICAEVKSANVNGLNIDLWIDETVESAAAK